MRGTVQNKVDRETRFNNEFDKFVVAPREALVSIYNHFAQLMNDLERNGITFPLVTVNTKFLNYLQPEWLKAKKLEKSHDPLALIAHTGSSSRTTSPYYVIHPSSVVDYDDDYQGDAVQNNSEDPLTSAMILLAHACDNPRISVLRWMLLIDLWSLFACTGLPEIYLCPVWGCDNAITQHFSNPTNNRLHTSSNTKNQAIVQADRVHIQSKNSGNDGMYTRRSYVQEEVIKGTIANVQCYNCSEKGHYARNCPKPRVRDSKYFIEQMLLAKQDEAGVTLTNEQNDFLFADATRMEEIKELSANICLMIRIQPTNINSDAGPSYDSAFLSEVQTPSTSYVNPLFAKDNQEQKYPKQPKIINNTIGDDQIDSNIIFDEPNVDVNSGSVEHDNNIQASYALEQLALNAYEEVKKQQINADKVKQQNKVLTEQLELYKEKVGVFKMTKGDKTTFLTNLLRLTIKQDD
ncbi:retrovirus-related pol polyprotein from transposon TNT 1-94 [Tanacetum coccineum]